MAEEENEEINEDVENEEVDNEEVNSEEEEEISLEDYKKLKEEFEKTREYLQKANKEAKNYRLKAKKFEETGYSPEDLQELKEKQEKQKLKEYERKGEWEKLKNQLTEQFEREKQQYEEQLNKMKSSMEKNVVEKEVVNAINKHEGISRILEPHVKSAVQLVEEDDGTMVPRVVDNDGSPKFNTKGEYMSVDEYVATLREDEEFGVAFKGRGQSGAGTKSTNSTGGQKPKSNKKRSEMDEKEKHQIIKEHGIDYYQSIPL